MAINENSLPTLYEPPLEDATSPSPLEPSGIAMKPRRLSCPNSNNDKMRPKLLKPSLRHQHFIPAPCNLVKMSLLMHHNHPQ